MSVAEHSSNDQSGKRVRVYSAFVTKSDIETNEKEEDFTFSRGGGVQGVQEKGERPDWEIVFLCRLN